MSDILAIKQSLNDRALEVASKLLPGGKLIGNEWCIGSVRGEPGESLKVRVKGGKAGLWTDFAEGGEGGDLIDLWAEVRGLQLPETLEEIRAYLGIERPQFDKPEKTYRKPSNPNAKKPVGPVFKYLTETRKIPAQTMERYGVGERDREMVFVSRVDGEPRFVKYLSIDRQASGKKIVRVDEGCEPVLFGWQAIDPNARTVVITEGEIDALSMHAYGIPAVSVPFGGGKGAKQRWIESDFDRLSRFETIYLALDNDEEGEAGVAEIVSRLGRHRCRRVRLPRKDANQCLIDGITSVEIRKCIDDAMTMDPAELRRAGDFTQAVVNLFWPKDGDEQGYRLPFGKIRDRIIFRPSELTIWTGPTGSGKSQLLSHACVEFADQGARVCVASLEMAPAQLLRRMVKQCLNTDRPTEEAIHAAMGWLHDSFWIFDHVGKSKIEKMLEVFDYARTRYGCTVFVVDSLMRLGVGSEDYEGQEKAVYSLVDWAVGAGVHVHLVAHARKGDSRFGSAPPELDDVKGAQEVAANAFNVLGVWRNRKLEDEKKALLERIERGDESARPELDEKSTVPPVILNVAKQRNGDWEGKCGLWFSRDSYQYRSTQDSPHGREYVSVRIERAA